MYLGREKRYLYFSDLLLAHPCHSAIMEVEAIAAAGARSSKLTATVIQACRLDPFFRRENHKCRDTNV